MSLFLHPGLLLAEASQLDESLRHMGDGFRDDPLRFQGGIGWVVALILVGLLPAVWILGRLAGRFHRRLTRSGPQGLFAGLCRAHGLTRGDRRLLWRLARFQELENPGRLFLEPERLDPAALDPRLESRLARYQAIRRRLFAGLKVSTSP